VIVEEGATDPRCDDEVEPAASAENPEADPGFLCVFVGYFSSGQGSVEQVLKPGEPEEGYGKTGASLELFTLSAAADVASGTFAVTAE
jgi:hypothetical protein